MARPILAAGLFLAVLLFANYAVGGGAAGAVPPNLRIPPGLGPVTFEVPTSSSAISATDAVARVGGRTPDLVAFVLATVPGVGPGLHPSIPEGGLAHRPVYVLQYENWPLVELGPNAGGDSSTVGVAQTYVDATTGEVLFAITFGN